MNTKGTLAVSYLLRNFISVVELKLEVEKVLLRRLDVTGGSEETGVKGLYPDFLNLWKPSKGRHIKRKEKKKVFSLS